MNHVLDVLDEVLSWDMPDEATAEALSTHACHAAGTCADDVGAMDID